jgi:hypothetical protein
VAAAAAAATADRRNTLGAEPREMRAAGAPQKYNIMPRNENIICEHQALKNDEVNFNVTANCYSFPSVPH